MFELSAGQIIADKYRIDTVIGSGGMGVVVAATHLELDQRVAIKLLRDASPDAMARFRREARLLVKLKSPHVARVYDVGALDDDTPYIVMELLEGKDLSVILGERGRLGVEETVDYVLEAAEAVAEAHVHGMVHRDLKPANLFLAVGPGGATTVKILDFGVSKVLDAHVSEQTTGGLTNEGVALGSPGYMAPEQMTSSRDVDARADIYSLGAMLYRLVSGKNPYKGNSVVSVLAAMAMDPLPSLDAVVPSLPAGFSAVVEKALAQDREARWPTVAHFAHALAPYASRRGRASAEQVLATLNIALGPFGSTFPRPSLPSAPPLASAPPPAPDKSWMLVLAAAVLVFAVLGAGVVWVRTTRAHATTVPSPMPASAPAPVPAPAPSAERVDTNGTVLGASPEPPEPSEPAPTTSASGPARAPKPARSKPKPHGGSRPPPLAPPSPTDVPEGRL